MDEILSKAHYRRAFYVVVLLLLALALVMRFWVLPVYEPALKVSATAILASLLDNLAVSVFVTVAIGSFVFWLRPEIMKRSVIEVIEPKQINRLLKTAAETSSSWIYKGTCGRYTRATTLPKFAQAARAAGIGRDVTICILNPRNSALCAAYATYRRSLKSGNGTRWTQQMVQQEAIATAVTALKFMYSEPLLRIRLFFVDSFSAFRLDISDQYVIVTKEDKEASALKADAGTYFYDSYKDVRLTERQGSEIKSPGLELNGPISEPLLRDVIKRVGLVDEATLDGLDVEYILQGVNSPTDPYN